MSGATTDTHQEPVGFKVAPLDLGEPLSWLHAGWHDLLQRPASSLAYGVIFFVISWLIVGSLFVLNADWILFPATAGFMLVGPVLAVGLYEKSRALAEGRSVGLADMLRVKGESASQIAFAGVILMLLLMTWLRAAVVIYALFFGLKPFPGFDQITSVLFLTLDGWAMIAVGSLIGGLFAALAFAISAFSIPMMLVLKIDVFSAMGRSFVMVLRQFPTMVWWGLIITVLVGLGCLVGFLGMIVVFPLLGHATWHAYRAVFPENV